MLFCACGCGGCVSILFCFFFFFSSRRRHTRCLSDWSSDVCSSDLYRLYGREDAFQSLIYPGLGHVYTPEMWEKTLAWMDEHLGASADRRLSPQCRTACDGAYYSDW